VIQLHCHTKFSIADGLSSSKDLAKAAGPGSVIAITDHDNMSGVSEHVADVKAAGCIPLVGLEAKINYGANKRGNLTLLADGKDGLQSLQNIMISNKTFDDLSAHRNGVVCLTGDITSPIANAFLIGREDLALKNLSDLRDIYGDSLYGEIIDHGFVEQKFYNHWLKRQGLKIVHTNDVHYAKREHCISQVALMCDHKSVRLTERQIGFKWNDMAYMREVPETTAMKEIVERCSGISIKPDGVLMPDYRWVPEGMTQASYLKELVKQGLVKRGVRNNQTYIDRAKFELEVISKMGFCGYFLVVWDFIKWAKDNGIFVGPGRGSGAGSIIAWLLEITNVDPIVYDLLFERFLNPDRVSMPDFDIDFEDERRHEVIDYVVKRYGFEYVAQIATFSEVACRSAFKLGSRIMGIKPSTQNAYTRLLPDNVGEKKRLSDLFDTKGKPLTDTSLDRPDLYASIAIGMGAEGSLKSVGKHAAGVLISNKPISQCVPVWKIANSDLNPTPFDKGGDNHTIYVSQVDKDKAESKYGLVKFDFLGLKELTVIKHALRMIREQGKPVPNFEDGSIDRDDPATWALVASGRTIGVFQLSSDGLSEFCKILRPTCFDHGVAATALYRPGPKDALMHLEFAERKNGKKPVTYLHPLLEKALKKTLGIIVYQEQVMEIARTVAGYTLGGADLLRRAMGKKDADEMARQQAIFLKGTQTQGIDEETAISIWDEVKTFARYGFNLSHSVTYNEITFRTAYLKAHFTAELLAAQMQARRDDADAISVFIKDAKDFGIEVKEVNILDASWRFRVKDGVIRCGMCGIKGISDPFAMSVERRAPKSIVELFSMMDIGKTDYEALVQSGALDPLLPTGLPEQVRCDALAQFNRLKKNPGQVDLFAGECKVEKGVTKGFSKREMLDKEFASTGRFISGHPVSILRSKYRRLPLATVEQMDVDYYYTALLLLRGMREFETAKGDHMAFMSMEDETGMIDITAFPGYYQDNRSKLVEGRVYLCEIRTSLYNEKFSASINKMESVE
jgi:DNA polymerase-3 subunit alpha